MKSTKIAILAFAALAVLSLGCKEKKNDDPTPAQSQLEKLTGSFSSNSSRIWTVQSVTYGNSEDRTSDWTNFQITLSNNGSTYGYQTANAFSPGPWPATGTWTFGGTEQSPNINTVIRNDGLEIGIALNTNSTPNTLTLTFIYDDAQHTGGRVDAVNGEYVFVMTSN